MDEFCKACIAVYDFGDEAMRTFAVIGMSSFGYYLCRFLAQHGIQVMAIDNDENKIDDVKPFVQKAIVADAKDKDALKALGLEDIDVVVVSVGEPIDTSVLITLYLRELDVKEIVAKAVSEDHGKILDRIGATTIIFPERDMALRTAYILRRSSLLDYVSLGDGYSIIEMAPPNAWLRKPLAELDIRKKYQVQIVMIKELVPERVTLIPGGDHVLKDSDILIVVGRDEDLQQIEKL